MRPLAALLAVLLLTTPATADDKKKKPGLKEKLKKLLIVPHTFKADGNVLSVHYGLKERKELSDWKVKGFDKAEVKAIKSKTFKGTGLELGVGSRKVGRLVHKAWFRGDFELKLTVYVAINPPSAMLCFLLGKKVGVNWGQQLVRPNKGLRPWSKKSKPADRTVFKEARQVKLVFKRVGTTLTVKCDGLKTAEREFKKGELDAIQIGLIAKNLRLVILDWSITGAVDPRKTK